MQAIVLPSNDTIRACAGAFGTPHTTWHLCAGLDGENLIRPFISLRSALIAGLGSKELADSALPSIAVAAEQGMQRIELKTI